MLYPPVLPHPGSSLLSNITRAPSFTELVLASVKLFGLPPLLLSHSLPQRSSLDLGNTPSPLTTPALCARVTRLTLQSVILLGQLASVVTSMDLTYTKITPRQATEILAT